ncbi:MAG TPA: holin [Candidatus Limnocylindrales bacterium]|nr:holin [Candidatus Limnocylindrales bacterium]
MTFTRDAVERVVRTVIQAALAAVLAVWVSAGSFSDIDWNTVWQVALYAGGLALLTALAGSKVGSSNDASFQTPADE